MRYGKQLTVKEMKEILAACPEDAIFNLDATILAHTGHYDRIAEDMAYVDIEDVCDISDATYDSKNNEVIIKTSFTINNVV